MGLLVAFFALLVNIRLKPYADAGLNFVSQVSQLNLVRTQRGYHYCIVP